MAHIAVQQLYEASVRPHGPEWAQLMVAASFEPSVRIALKSRSRSKKTTSSPALLHVHRCPICDMQRVAKRHVAQWRCRSCVEAGLEGALLVERVEAKRGRDDDKR
ncbi:MAG: hypothetical protein JRH20_28365 [Deltaproteobacteria bacterium]|nr:hypothetical protein [Deltaproteobacteria bacterium]